MANNINISTVVDVVTTVNQGTGPAARVTLFDDNTENGYVGDPASNEITINCKYGDILHFYFQTLNPSIGVVATKFVPTQGNVITVGYSNAHWSGTVVKSGTETFHFTFMIDGQSGTYWFDPFINVSIPS